LADAYVVIVKDLPIELSHTLDCLTQDVQIVFAA